MREKGYRPPDLVLTCGHALKYFLGEPGKWGRCSACKGVVKVRVRGEIQRARETEKYQALQIQIPETVPDKPRPEVVEWAMRANGLATESKPLREMPGGIASVPLPLSGGPAAHRPGSITIHVTALDGVEVRAEVPLTTDAGEVAEAFIHAHEVAEKIREKVIEKRSWSK